MQTQSVDTSKMSFDERMARLDSLMEAFVEEGKQYRKEVDRMFDEFEAKLKNR